MQYRHSTVRNPLGFVRAILKRAPLSDGFKLAVLHTPFTSVVADDAYSRPEVAGLDSLSNVMESDPVDRTEGGIDAK